MENETALSVTALVNAIIAWLSAALAAFQAGVLPAEREQVSRGGVTPASPVTIRVGWRWWPSLHPFGGFSGALPDPATLFGAGRGASRADDAPPPAVDGAPRPENPAGPGVPAPRGSARRVTQSPDPTIVFPTGAPTFDVGGAATGSIGAGIVAVFWRAERVVPIDGRCVFARNAVVGKPCEFSNWAFGNAIFHDQFVTNWQ